MNEDKNTIEAISNLFEIQKSKVTDLESKLNKEKALLSSFDMILQMLNGNISNLPNNANSYKLNSISGKIAFDNKSTWEERVKAYINYNNKATLSSEIIECFKEYFPDYTDTQYRNIVAGNLSILVSRGELKKVKPFKMKGYYYIKPSWGDAEGKILEGYAPQSIKQDW